MSRDTLLDEAIAKAKEAEDWQLVEWLRMARGGESAAKWYTEKLRGLEDENARLRSCLSDDAENARMIMGENEKLRKMSKECHELLQDILAGCSLHPVTVEVMEQRMCELGIEVSE